MAGNNSIQILRGTDSTIKAHADDVLLSGQLLVNLNSKRLYVGDGTGTISATTSTNSVTNGGIVASAADKLVTGRDITIGNTSRTFDGTAGISYSHADMGLVGLQFVVGSNVTPLVNYSENTTSIVIDTSIANKLTHNKLIIKPSVGDWIIGTNNITDRWYIYEVTASTNSSATVKFLKYLSMPEADDFWIRDNRILIGPGAGSDKGATQQGPYSVAIGVNANVPSQGAVALGPNTDATGINALALGANALANALSAVAVGAYSKSQFENSIAIGSNANAHGGDNRGNISIGYNNEVYATRCVGIGMPSNNRPNNILNNSYDSVAIGSGAQVSNCGPGIAIGSDVTAQNGNCAIAIGWGSSARADDSIAIGHDAVVTAYNAVQIGKGTNNTSGTLQTPYRISAKSIALQEPLAGMNIIAAPYSTGSASGITYYGYAVSEAPSYQDVITDISFTDSNLLAYARRINSHITAVQLAGYLMYIPNSRGVATFKRLVDIPLLNGLTDTVRGYIGTSAGPYRTYFDIKTQYVYDTGKYSVSVTNHGVTSDEEYRQIHLVPIVSILSIDSFSDEIYS